MILSLMIQALQMFTRRPTPKRPFSVLLFIAFGLGVFIPGCGLNKQVSQTHSPNELAANNLKEALNRPSPPIDLSATKETKALLKNLNILSQQAVLFGHQDDMAYGVHWIDEEGRSDVKDTAGAYPAVTGWELGGLALRHEANLDDVNFKKMAQWIKAIYLRGGINTISWHMYNPVTGENAWSDGEIVKQIIPGGEFHEKLKTYLDQFVAFNKQLKVKNEDSDEEIHIPIIFRPWHEHNGDWFWWGKDNTKEEDYRALWQFTVNYLRDTHQQHNLIYAFSPDRSRIDLSLFRRDYLWGYPGDEFVDIIGIDNYHDLKHTNDETEQAINISNFSASLEEVVRLADEKNKLAALTEGGSEGIGNPNFWTEVYLKGISHNETTLRIAYALVWRNANKEKENREHFYAPFPEHPSAESFKTFYKSEFTLFNDGLHGIYLKNLD